jgi:hypothetical protein
VSTGHAIYGDAIRRVLVRHPALAHVDARHVEARIRETTKSAPEPLGAIAFFAGDRWTTLVVNAAAAVQALPVQESETLAQLWHL